MKMIKRLVEAIKIIFLRAEVNECLKKLNVGLEEENSRLRGMVIEQADLVLQYKRAMQQTRDYIIEMAQKQSEIDYYDGEREEEEGNIDPFELLRKKNTIH